jgi:hypothetical protein
MSLRTVWDALATAGAMQQAQTLWINAAAVAATQKKPVWVQLTLITLHVEREALFDHFGFNSSGHTSTLKSPSSKTLTANARCLLLLETHAHGLPDVIYGLCGAQL